jgi:hypothetical protein
MTRLAILASTFIGLAAASALGCAGDDTDAPSGAAGTAGEQTSAGSSGDGAKSGTGGDSAGDSSASGTSSGSGSTGGDSAGGTSAGGTSAGGGGLGLAGSDGSGGTAGSDEAGGSAGTGTSGTGAGGDSTSGGGTGSSGEPPYAHVVAVSASGTDQNYQFAVSIESADIDCTQFANWWEVLGEDGTLLYRRILEHSHTDENGTSDPEKPGNTFTRSGGPVPISGDTVVIVRAHMSTGGYNGRVLRGSANAVFADAPDITSGFAAEVEDAAPQPTGCDF